MLPLIISCTRSWNFAWHILWHSTTESKNFIKLLAICQTIHTVCFKDDYIPKGKFKLFNGLFHSGYLVFPKCLFSIADLFAVRYLWVLCTRPWSFVWHFSLELDKLKLLAIGLHTVCCVDDYFPKGKFKLFHSLFHSVYPVFTKRLFSFPDLFAVRHVDRM